MRAGLVAGAMVLFALTACSGGAVDSPTASPSTASSTTPASANLTDDAVITYAFHDSSVPPQYHRSVTLTVTKDSSHVVVDSYGDVLADKTTPTPPEVWATLGTTLPDVASVTVDPVEQGCTGGTGITLTVVSGGATVLSLDPQFCAGSNVAAEAAINTWIAPARALFPATDVLAPVDQ